MGKAVSYPFYRLRNRGSNDLHRSLTLKPEIGTKILICRWMCGSHNVRNGLQNWFPKSVVCCFMSPDTPRIYDSPLSIHVIWMVLTPFYLSKIVWVIWTRAFHCPGNRGSFRDGQWLPVVHGSKHWDFFWCDQWRGMLFSVTIIAAWVMQPCTC